MTAKNVLLRRQGLRPRAHAPTYPLATPLDVRICRASYSYPQYNPTPSIADICYGRYLTTLRASNQSPDKFEKENLL